MSLGVDIGTAFIIRAEQTDDNKIAYSEFRNSFFRMKPATPIAGKMMEKGLANLAYFKDTDGSYVVVGQDAINKAIERNSIALRPLRRGVINPLEPEARRVLKFILSELVGKPNIPGETLVYSVPAEPVDQDEEDFNTGYHEDVLKKDLSELGWKPQPLNEAEAICYSELEDEDYSGISCLVPGTKIYTNRGILPIEEVKEEDQVITHEGRWKPVNKVIVKQFSGLMTKLQLNGYSNNTEEYKFVDNHEIFVNRNNRWEWIGCEEVEEGDLVGEPIVKQDRFRTTLPAMTICGRITCSKQYAKKRIPCHPDVQRLIGYFLGDGKAQKNNIAFDFGEHEEFYIKDVQEILLKNFGKESSVIDRSKYDDGKMKQVICYSKGLARYFRNHFYDSNKEKLYPWSLERLTDNECLNLLAGLIRSDGCFDNPEDNISKGFSFENTSSNLAILTKQLCSRIGIAASISWRLPRKGGFIDNKQIIGKKNSWAIQAHGRKVSQSILSTLETVNCENSTRQEKIFVSSDGFCCSKIQKIEHDKYDGIVFDLQVEDDHSFSGPYLTIHNCSFGAGMVNFCVMSSGEPVLKFSLTRSGDWLDRMAAQSTAQKDTVVQVEKENGTFIVGEESNNPILSAVSAYYVRLIDYAVQHLSVRLSAGTDLPKFTDPIPVVVSGGTSKAQGFVEAFRKRLEQSNFPFKIKEVRSAKDPLRAVARGLLLSASLDDT